MYDESCSPSRRVIDALLTQGQLQQDTPAVWIVVGLLALAACGRVGFDEVRTTDGGVDLDGRGLASVTHVPPTSWSPGTDVVVVTGTSTLDTTQLELDGVAMAELFASPQVGGGGELAILAVDRLEVPGTLRVIGARPLVVIANAIEVEGTIDGAARRDVPGPGGAVPSAGAGAGQPGVSMGLYDSAGSGAGFGSSGGGGGLHACGSVPGGIAGTAYGDNAQAIFVGGSGGGAGSPGMCMARSGGAGGGAIQLSARDSITISGVVHAGGGGGAGGSFCNGNDAGAGSGGGSGGALFLEAPLVDVRDGAIAANGGSGGAGGGGGGPAGANGVDATTSAVQATGAVGTGGGASGGNGGSRTAPPSPGQPGSCSGAAGGGGGSYGRIAIRTAMVIETGGVVTPAFTEIAY